MPTVIELRAPLNTGRKAGRRRLLLPVWTVPLAALMFLIAATAHAASARTGSVADLDADDGLPDARIGTPLANFTGLRKTDDAGRWLSFERPGDKLNFLGVELKSITYNFFKDRLYSIDLELQGKRNITRMLKALESRYGKTHTLETRTYQHTNAQMEVREWAGTKMYCDYKSAVDGAGAELVLLDKPTWDLLQLPKEQQAAAYRQMLKGSYINGDF
jgi:hypothetical protein